MMEAVKRLHLLLAHKQFSRGSHLFKTTALSFVFPNQRTNLQRQKRSLFNYSNTSRTHLERLETEANKHPNDPYLQSRFLSELNKNHPQIVIQRVNSGFFANNDSVGKEYIKALVSTNQLDNTPSKSLFQAFGNVTPVLSTPYSTSSSQSSASMSSSSSSFEGEGESFNGKTGPIQVQLVEPTFRTQLWKAVRFMAIAYLLFSFAGVIIGEMDVPKQLGVSHGEVKPSPNQGKTFDDVKGATEAKEELQEIVHYLRNPQKFTKLGGKLPKGVLLTGPPGTGKTLLAKAIAGEAGVPFYYASGSEFEEMYVGVGARRVRDLFNAAKHHAPCIVFIDEIDAIGSTRALKEQQAMKMTLNQLLVELDGFNESQGVIIIAATNFPELLDPALIRPGRFDRNVVVPLPDVRDRAEILKHYLAPIPHANINLATLARGTPGLSGADLFNLINIAALRAATNNLPHVSMAELEYAKDKILMGGERKSAVIPQQVRTLTAWHESGHALVAYFTAGALPLHKATVLPRGPALGMVVQLPEEVDLLQRSKRQMLAEIDVCMGGRVAEEVVFGPEEVTSGASSDIQKATSIARRMVSMYGMSDKLGAIYLAKERGEEGSGMYGKIVEEEVKRILTESYDRVTRLVKQHRRELGSLATALLDHETLTKEEIEAVIQGKSIGKTKEEIDKIGDELNDDISGNTGPGGGRTKLGKKPEVLYSETSDRQPKSAEISSNIVKER